MRKVTLRQIAVMCPSTDGRHLQDFMTVFLCVWQGLRHTRDCKQIEKDLHLSFPQGWAGSSDPVLGPIHKWLTEELQRHCEVLETLIGELVQHVQQADFAAALAGMSAAFSLFGDGDGWIDLQGTKEPTEVLDARSLHPEVDGDLPDPPPDQGVSGR